jgi:zinc transporter ZupT
MAANRFGLGLAAHQGVRGDALYWVRFIAFALILIAIVDKTAGLALVFALSAAAGAALLYRLRGRVLTGVLAFGCAALLYLVSEERLVEAHEVEETDGATSAFFAGFLLLLVLGR